MPTPHVLREILTHTTPCFWSARPCCSRWLGKARLHLGNDKPVFSELSVVRAREGVVPGAGLRDHRDHANCSVLEVWQCRNVHVAALRRDEGAA
jgi:hypothetical protein